MDGSGECAGIRPQLGVYLTGAIAPADREAVVRHLAGCEDCRAELAGLAGLPALLRRPDVAAAAQPPADDRPEDHAARPEDHAARPEAGEALPEDHAARPEAGEALLTRLLSSVARRRRHRLPAPGRGSPGSWGPGTVVP
jgi:anti-sigma factor RsiW